MNTNPSDIINLVDSPKNLAALKNNPNSPYPKFRKLIEGKQMPRIMGFKPTKGTYVNAYYKQQWYNYAQYVNVWYSFEYCQYLINGICHTIGVPNPVVKSSDTLGQIAGGCFCPVADPTIVLPMEGATGTVLLHELAHYLELYWYGRKWYSKNYHTSTHHTKEHARIMKYLANKFWEVIRIKDWKLNQILL